MEEKPTVLVVDDDKDIREFLCLAIEEMGYTAKAAPDGETALEILQSDAGIDLILLDVIMPGITGFDVLRAIRKESRHNEIKIIMVTAMQQISDKELAFMIGANDYLEKPFESRELVARVRTHVNLKRATQRVIIQKQIQDTILSTVPGIVYLKDRNGRYIHGNEQFADLLGIQVADIRGKSDEELFSADIATGRCKTDEIILDFKVPTLEYEEDMITKDGDIRYYFTKKRPVKDQAGNICGLVGVSVDITEQVIMKEAYYEKEALLSAVVENLPCELWVTGPDNSFILQNQAHFNRWGNIIGKKLDDLPIQSDLITEWRTKISAALEGKHFRDEYTRKVSDQTHWYLKTLSPVQTELGIVGALGVKLDITSLKRPTEGGEDTTLAISTILNLISDPVLVVSEGFQIIFRNSTAAAIQGCVEGTRIFSSEEEVSRFDSSGYITLSDHTVRYENLGTIMWQGNLACVLLLREQNNGR
ncbi:MAG TPA: response regulator [Methanospirillum sp.]|nr:response regulator [Methanospirillum sp.]